MNSDGSERQFLATFDYGIMQDQYTKLQEQYRWSPDGRTRSYVTRENDVNQIWIERADGSIRPRAITHLGDIAYDPQWSPDGETPSSLSARPMAATMSGRSTPTAAMCAR